MLCVKALYVVFFAVFIIPSSVFVFSLSIELF